MLHIYSYITRCTNRTRLKQHFTLVNIFLAHIVLNMFYLQSNIIKTTVSILILHEIRSCVYFETRLFVLEFEDVKIHFDQYHICVSFYSMN